MSSSSFDLYYTNAQIDRRSTDRPRTELITETLYSEQARFVVLSDNQNLFELKDDLHHPAFLERKDVEAYIPHHPWAYLGVYGNHALFVLDLSVLEDQALIEGFENKYLFEDLRRAAPVHQRTEASQLAYARGLMYWHKRHRFCGACGSETESQQAGHVRKCLNPECGLEHFPRTDPAVIMLVTHGDKCLLGRHSRLKAGMYSTLAGFVEPGETLEDAVRREVMEEAGIKVGKVTYAASQPWPFPTSLMLGFYGEAETTEISFADDELEDAQWFTRDELINIADQGKSLASHDSIARQLIENWIKAG
ncbi:NAD(+) diphosphatase [Terasakiella pusilla]|uniref:NAD(+) diphosphatase n=1 Tax=Terasakiella pusilla TaxID=64973 RepID=UPI003AA88CF7